MTFGELKIALLDAVFAGADDYETPTLGRFVNQALQHVGNMIAQSRPHLLYATWNGIVSNTAPDTEVLANLSAEPYSQARGLVRGERRGITDESPALKIIEYHQIEHEIGGSTKEKPPLFLFENTFGFVQPEDQSVLRVVYIHGLPEMLLDSDTPGQRNGVGGANKIPVEYHPLIVWEAAALLHTAESSPAQREARSAADRLAYASGLALEDRKRAPGKG